MSITHFIWDFDGTLFDTYPFYISYLQHALKDFGHDATEVELMARMLKTMGATFDYCAEKFGIPKDALLEKWALYRGQMPPFCAKPFDGASDVLHEIKERGGHNYLFSHAKKDFAKGYFAKYGILSCFDDIITCEDDHFPFKPAPDAILHLMRKYGFTGDEAVMIGDRDIDLASGRNAGVKTAHFVCKLVPEILECDFRAETLYDLLKIMQ